MEHRTKDQRMEAGVEASITPERSPEAETETSQEAILEAWRGFTQGLAAGPSMDEVIVASWRRSREAGVNPEIPRFHRLAEDETGRRILANRRLIEAAKPVVHELSESVPVDHVVYLTDCDGIVLYSTGTSPVLAEECGLLPGYDWSEGRMGTNGAGTALASGQPVAVLGCDHYCRAWHHASCVAAPVRAPGGAVVGCLDLTTSMEEASPLRLADVARAAFKIERAFSSGGDGTDGG